MAGGGCGQDAVLANEQLLDTVCGTDLCDQLNDLRVPISAITTNDQEGACPLCQSLLGVGISAGRVGGGEKRPTLYTFWDRQENAGDKRFTVVWLLEDSSPLPKPRSLRISATCRACGRAGSLGWNGVGQAQGQGERAMVRGEAVDNPNLRSGLLVREGRELNLLDAHTDRIEFRCFVCWVKNRIGYQ